MRGVNISCMALLLLAALVAGPCVACFAASHPCCTHCEKAGKCAASPLNLNHLQTVQSDVSFSLEESGVALTWSPVPEASRDALAVEAPYSPPDLYLRNSVLNI
ncbi:MAG: hypothetical protein ABSH47_19485 [Bryobacteraceae bacterium]|jgi:hypothetical protein